MLVSEEQVLAHAEVIDIGKDTNSTQHEFITSEEIR